MVLAEMVGSKALSFQGKGARVKGADMTISVTEGIQRKPAATPITRQIAERSERRNTSRPRNKKTSFDSRSAVAQSDDKRVVQRRPGRRAMPAYEICYLDCDGSLTYTFAATCDDHNRAKVLAHAMKLPGAKRLEVWHGEALIYARPSDSHPMREQTLRRA